MGCRLRGISDNRYASRAQESAIVGVERRGHIEFFARRNRDDVGMTEGVVVVILVEGRYLMIRRAAHLLAGGAWCFVGGAIDPGESQPDAVVREFHEEVGGLVRPIRKVWEYTRPDGRLRLHWWLAELLDGVLVANPSEVAEIRWVRRDEIPSLENVLESNLRFLIECGGLLDGG